MKYKQLSEFSQTDPITIGKIIKAQGIKGDVKVLPLTDPDFDFFALKNISIDSQDYVVERCYKLSGAYGLKLRGINDMNSAEFLKNKQICITRQQLNLPKGRYLIADLINRPVALNTGKVLGKIVDIQNYGSADVIYIDNGGIKLLCSHKAGLIKQIDELGRVIFDAKIFAEVGVYED